jgi:hypothetical protein
MEGPCAWPVPLLPARHHHHQGSSAQHTSASLTLLSRNAVGVELLLPLEPALPVLPVATALRVAAPHPHIAATPSSRLAGRTACSRAVLQRRYASKQTECRSHLLLDDMPGSGHLAGCLRPPDCRRSGQTMALQTWCLPQATATAKDMQSGTASCLSRWWALL